MEREGEVGRGRDSGADEASLHGRGSHTGDHNWRLAEETRERSIDMQGAIAMVHVCQRILKP